MRVRIAEEKVKKREILFKRVFVFKGLKEENKKITQKGAGERKHLHNVQPLLQHRFEMHGSTYMWIVFNSKYTVLHNLGLVKSMDANHGYKGVNYRL